VYLASIADSNQNIQALLPVSMERGLHSAFPVMCRTLFLSLFLGSGFGVPALTHIADSCS
jgi:hypothetical protein